MRARPTDKIKAIRTVEVRRSKRGCCLLVVTVLTRISLWTSVHTSYNAFEFKERFTIGNIGKTDYMSTYARHLGIKIHIKGESRLKGKHNFAHIRKTASM